MIMFLVKGFLPAPLLAFIALISAPMVVMPIFTVLNTFLMHVGLNSSANEHTHDCKSCGHGKASEFQFWHLPGRSSEKGLFLTQFVAFTKRDKARFKKTLVQ